MKNVPVPKGIDEAIQCTLAVSLLRCVRLNRDPSSNKPIAALFCLAFRLYRHTGMFFTFANITTASLQPNQKRLNRRPAITYRFQETIIQRIVCQSDEKPSTGYPGVKWSYEDPVTTKKTVMNVSLPCV